jgi:hypothetical protein
MIAGLLVSLLAALPAPSAPMAELLSALQSPDAEARGRARRELSARGAAAVEPLLEVAAGEGDLSLRRLALSLLADVADGRVTPQVVDLMHDPDLALAACGCLQRLPGTPPTAALAVGLGWADPTLQIALLEGLALRGDSRSAPDVERLLASPHPAARAAAADALRRITVGRPTGKPTFRQVRLAEEGSLVEACTVLDANRDGRLDVASGGFWYEAPSWTPHAYREMANDGSYADDWAEFALDVNGDGWTDVLSGGFHTDDVAWYENPQGREGLWPRHVAWSRGGEFYETVVMSDLDGDGQGDFLPNAGAPIRWFELVRDEGGDPEFVRHDIGGEGAGHGIGYGDVNLDGRLDVITPSGWYEAPDDPRAGAWAWHPEFSLGPTSVPILAHDVNGDALADIIWGGGHAYGLHVLMQRRDGDTRSWEPQAIDNSFTQAHAPELADLDSDGSLEIVVGKRWKAHLQGDPGLDDPLYVYSFAFDRETEQWRRETISYDARAGIGLQQSIMDLDADGDLDIVSACKTGLFVFVNEAIPLP